MAFKRKILTGEIVSEALRGFTTFDQESESSWDALCLRIFKKKSSKKGFSEQKRRLKNFLSSNPILLEKTVSESQCIISCNEDMMYGENSDLWMPKKILPETSDFSLKDDDWDSLLGCISGRKIVNEDWPDLMRDALKRSNPYCSYGFQRHEIYRKKNGEISMYFIGACRIPPCQSTLSIRCCSKNRFTATFSGYIEHGTIKSQPLKGTRRLKFAEILKNQTPRQAYLEHLGKISQEIFESGNRDDAPSASVLKKLPLKKLC